MAHRKYKSEKINKSELVSKDVDSKEYLLTKLPPELKEISGITFLNDSVFLAIADENGTLYYFDTRQNRIIKKQNFGKPDDYEDLVRVGNDLYIVVSNGLIHHLKNFASNNPEIISFKTPLQSKNNIEGITYDAKNDRLLLAAKDIGIDNNDKIREIYAYNLKSKTFQSAPAFTIDIENIEKQFAGDALEESSKKFLKALGNENMNRVFRPSALSIKPSTNELYVLSSINNLIAVISPTGKLVKIIPLTGKDFKQPEGIAFSPDESLYISNEGRSGLGNIIKLKHEK